MSALSQHTASINEIEMYYEIHGDGEPLLLLHGFTGCGGDWAHIDPELTKGFQAIVPDMRGHGRSTNPSSIFSHRQVASDMFALLDKLNIQKFKAVGLSGGGNALLHMAHAQPDRVEAMVLVSATSYFPEQARAIMRQVSIDTISEEEWQTLRQRHRHGDSQIRALYAQCAAFATSYDDMNFTPADLSTISARTMLVQGDRDVLYPIDISVEMYKAIQRCSLWVVPNAGHGPVFGDINTYFAKTAAVFLQAP